MKTKTCFNCIKEVARRTKLTSKRVFCNQTCYSEFRKTKLPYEEHHAYKGDKVGYGALHDWIRKHLGTPKFCEDCGNRKLRHRQYYWSNISGKYIRDLNDWRRLCVKCHSKFDKNR